MIFPENFLMVTVAVVAFTASQSQSSSAQICLGNPSRDGAAFGELGHWNYSGLQAFEIVIGANIKGPGSATAFYSLDNYVGVEANGFSVGGAFIYEIDSSPLSLCPIIRFEHAGLEYDYADSSSVHHFDGSWSYFASGVQFGKRLRIFGMYDIVPSLRAEYFFRATSIKRDDVAERGDVDTEFSATLRTTIFVGDIYNGFEVQSTTESGRRYLRLFVGIVF